MLHENVIMHYLRIVLQYSMTNLQWPLPQSLLPRFSYDKVSTEYKAWWNAKDRCYNTNNANYHHYGGRGITMWWVWRSDFYAFYMYIGPRPSPEHSLDRYPNNDGDYVPGNVRWATVDEQNSNRRKWAAPTPLKIIYKPAPKLLKLPKISKPKIRLRDAQKFTKLCERLDKWVYKNLK